MSDFRKPAECLLPDTMAGPPGERTSAVTTTREKILVVDDDENIRETLREFLSMGDYEVEAACDGREAMELLGRASFDLMLVDLRMPHVDGMSLLEWSQKACPEASVIVITGHATVETTIRALRLGAFDYLLKPFTLDEVARVVGNCLERSRLRRENSELTRVNQRLREVERIKDDLLATVSHEFRTPLTALQGFLSMLESQPEHPSRAGDAMDGLRDNVSRLDALISNLLILVEANSGALTPILEPVALGEFLRAWVRNGPAGDLRELVRLEVPECASDARVLVDRTRLGLCIANLVDNARKFTRDPASQEILLRASVDASRVHIDIHDNGIGVDAPDLAEAFDRFTQGDMSSTRAFPGAGLGLSVTRCLAEAHGGSVRFIQPELGGASVRITLPGPSEH
ncbi:MAG: hybrid sensor histidine kinase/response regulator [Gemmatimonadota bacterium]|nr:hybrid sensor histidine kinase/response regulator [Gemmatimonadota bacterium]